MRCGVMSKLHPCAHDYLYVSVGGGESCTLQNRACHLWLHSDLIDWVPELRTSLEVKVAKLVHSTHDKNIFFNGAILVKCNYL